MKNPKIQPSQTLEAKKERFERFRQFFPIQTPEAKKERFERLRQIWQIRERRKLTLVHINPSKPAKDRSKKP